MKYRVNYKCGELIAERLQSLNSVWRGSQNTVARTAAPRLPSNIFPRELGENQRHKARFPLRWAERANEIGASRFRGAPRKNTKNNSTSRHP